MSCLKVLSGASLGYPFAFRFLDLKKLKRCGIVEIRAWMECCVFETEDAMDGQL